MTFFNSLTLEYLLLQLPLIGKVALAMLLGLGIGWEREKAEKPAGLRTHMLVTGAACLLTLLGVEIIEFTDEVADAPTSADPTRILHALIVGISFIGGGAILKNKAENTVENLTTAASVLMAAGVGISVAVEKYYLGLALVILTLLTNVLMESLKKKMIKSKD